MSTGASGIVKNQDRLLSKDYVLLMFSSSVHALMNQFFLAAAPLYMVLIGGSTLHAGMLATVYSLTALAARPISGMASDRIGRVKLLIGGAALCAVTCALFGFASVLPLLLLVRGVTGVGFGVHSTCAGAAVADVLPKTRLAEGIGYFGLYATLAQAIGPGIALAIIAKDRIVDFRALFLLTAGLCTASALTNGCITYERKRKALEKADAANDAGAVASDAVTEVGSVRTRVAVEAGAEGALPKTFMGFEYSVFAPVAVLILLQTGIAGIMVFMAPFARWKGFGNPGLFYTVSAVGTLLSRLVFGKVADRRGSDVIIIPGLAVLAACMAMLPTVGSMGALVAFALPIGLSQGAVSPTINSMMFRRSSPARRGTASGAYFSAIDLGYAIGAPLLGALVDARDYKVMYWVAAAFLALALLVYILISTDRRYAKLNKINQ